MGELFVWSTQKLLRSWLREPLSSHIVFLVDILVEKAIPVDSSHRQRSTQHMLSAGPPTRTATSATTKSGLRAAGAEVPTPTNSLRSIMPAPQPVPGFDDVASEILSMNRCLNT